MKRRAFGIAVALLCVLLCSGSAFAIVGFRGSTWGELRGELPDDVENNMLLRGWVKQGVDWAKWGNVTLNTYATLRYQLDTEGYDWNNLVGPGLGIALEAYSSKGVTASFGVEYMWDRYIGVDEASPFDVNAQKLVIYANWYGWWDLMRK
jgi:hypothetical protein